MAWVARLARALHAGTLIREAPRRRDGRADFRAHVRVEREIQPRLERQPGFPDAPVGLNQREPRPGNRIVLQLRVIPIRMRASNLGKSARARGETLPDTCRRHGESGARKTSGTDAWIALP